MGFSTNPYVIALTIAFSTGLLINEARAELRVGYSCSIRASRLYDQGPDIANCSFSNSSTNLNMTTIRLARENTSCEVGTVADLQLDEGVIFLIAAPEQKSKDFLRITTFGDLVHGLAPDYSAYDVAEFSNESYSALIGRPLHIMMRTGPVNGRDLQVIMECSILYSNSPTTRNNKDVTP